MCFFSGILKLFAQEISGKVYMFFPGNFWCDQSSPKKVFGTSQKEPEDISKQIVASENEIHPHMTLIKSGLFFRCQPVDNSG